MVVGKSVRDGRRKLEEELVDLLLRPRVQPRLLAHVEHGGGVADEAEDLGRDQTVVQHDVRRLHEAQRLERQQFTRAAARPHQRDPANGAA